MLHDGSMLGLAETLRQLLCEKVEKFPLSRPDLGQDDMIKPGIDVAPNSVQMTLGLRAAGDSRGNGIRRDVLARRGEPFGVGQLGHDWPPREGPAEEAVRSCFGLVFAGRTSA
jgi:hypothetical protein